MSNTCRYIMIGGFLGSGKTTTVARLAQNLSASGARVGLITNDQGAGLVDTASLRAKGFATEEIAGGCFCCRFQSLADAAEKLTEDARPEYFIAEPVGSCTDLVATVSYPLRRLYGDKYTIAPMTTLVDPQRALRALGLTGGRGFSPKVTYIYKKQLEEADLIVINKIDSLSDADRETLQSALQEQFPNAKLLGMSARTGDGFSEWESTVLSLEASARDPMEVDYDIYAEGEAELGWLNATIDWKAEPAADPNEGLQTIASRIQEKLEAEGKEVAHLKMTLSPREGLDDIAIINLVRNDFVPELAQRIEEPVRHAQVILNLRAEADPELLESVSTDTFGELTAASDGLNLRVEHLEQFRPGRPEPTHRMNATG